MLKSPISERIKHNEPNTPFNIAITKNSDPIRYRLNVGSHDGCYLLSLHLSSRVTNLIYTHPKIKPHIVLFHAWLMREYVKLSTRILGPYSRSTVNPRIVSQGTKLIVHVSIQECDLETSDTRFNVLVTSIYESIEKIEKLSESDQLATFLKESGAEKYIGGVQYYTTHSLIRAYQGSLDLNPQLHGDTSGDAEPNRHKWGGVYSKVALDISSRVENNHHAVYDIDVKMYETFYQEYYGGSTLHTFLWKRITQQDSKIKGLATKVEQNRIQLTVQYHEGLSETTFLHAEYELLRHLAHSLEHLSYMVETLGEKSARTAMENLAHFTKHPSGEVVINK